MVSHYNCEAAIVDWDRAHRVVEGPKIMQAPAEGENIELLGGADLDVGNGDQVLSVSVDGL